MSVKILRGDCRELLKTLPDESVHCVVTSPPYWGLRSYGVDNAMGLEKTLAEHVDGMVKVFREVRRVLRKDGTLWLNYGDSYAANVNGRSANDVKLKGLDDRTFRDKPFSTIGPIRAGKSGNKGNPGSDIPFRVAADGFLKPKDLCGIPWRVAFALQADGWWLRSDIIWSKPNPMPESVTDRPTKSHEYLFLFSKSERYYYDNVAIAERCGSEIQSERTRKSAPRGIPKNGREQGKPTSLEAVPGGTGTSAYGVEHPSSVSELQQPQEQSIGYRNRRTVWEIPIAPFSEAHFATFPPALIEPCIKAGCPEKVCARCGAPWVRMTEKVETYGRRDAGGTDGYIDLGMSRGRAGQTVRSSLGFSPSCSCSLWGPSSNGNAIPGTVLDPFFGAGTTGLVADRLSRHCIGIELNPAYADMAEKRIHGDCPLFAATPQGAPPPTPEWDAMWQPNFWEKKA